MEEGYTIKRRDNVVKIRAEDSYGWRQDIVGETLCKVTDTGNGYIAKFPAFNSTEQDNYVCLDYAEADYLLQALKLFMEKDNA